MTIIGSILIVLGALACLAGEWRFLVITHRHGLAWFFGALFIPPVAVAFLCIHFKEAWRPFALSLVGLIIAGFGTAMVKLT